MRPVDRGLNSRASKYTIKIKLVDVGRNFVIIAYNEYIVRGDIWTLELS